MLADEARGRLVLFLSEFALKCLVMGACHPSGKSGDAKELDHQSKMLSIGMRGKYLAAGTQFSENAANRPHITGSTTPAM